MVYLLDVEALTDVINAATYFLFGKLLSLIYFVCYDQYLLSYCYYRSVDNIVEMIRAYWLYWLQLFFMVFYL